MLATFRAIAKSRITLVILFVPLMLGLLVFGNVRDVFSNMSTKDTVVSAGDRAVTSVQFKRIFDNAKQDYEKRSGAPISVEEAVAKGGLDEIIESLAGREGFQAALTKAGVRPSDGLIAEQMRKIPAFFDSVTGKFDPKLYRSRLTAEGLTPEVFEQGQKDDLAQAHFSAAVAAGLQAPAAYPAMAAALALEQRTFSAFGINPATIPQPAAPTDAQLAAFIKAHADAMRIPELRALTVVRFSAHALEPTIQINPADLQKRYDFRKDTLSTPEKRSVAQIPAKTQEAAAQAAARLAKGEDPAAVAKALGVDPILYKNAPRSSISDPGIAQAAFSLAAGQVSPPIKGGLGWAAVKVLAVTPGRTVTLAEARPSLEAELRAEGAQERIYDVVEKYQSTQEGGANLAEAARVAGVTALQLPPVNAEGSDFDGRKQPMLTPKLLKQAFALPQGGESEVVDDGKGEYFAVRVEKVFPPTLPTLATQRAPITAAYMRTEQMRLLQEHGEAFAERVRKGESMDAVAASAGSKVIRATIDRRSAEQDQSPQRRQLFSEVFAGKANSVANTGEAIVKIEAIKPGPTDQAALFTRIGQRQISQAVFQDIGEQAFKWTRREMKVKTDVNRARSALGLPAIETSAAKPAPAKAAAK